MTVKIKIKVSCNTANSTYNKGKKPMMLVEAKKIALQYNKLGIVVLKPHLDKLVFGFFITKQFLGKYDNSTTVEEYRASIVKSLYQDGYHEGTGITFMTVPFKKPYSTYKGNLRYTPPSSKESIFMQIEPYNSKLPFMRFDMNPNQFSKKAIAEFRAFLEELLQVPGLTIPYEEMLTIAKIYRADAAVDILGVRASDLEITPLKNGKAIAHKSHVYKSATGRAETLYPKAKKGKSSEEYFYDKRQEQLDEGEVPMYGDALHTRFECRIKDSTFYKMPNVKNRCARYSLRALCCVRFGKLALSKRLFVRVALGNGLGKGVGDIPDKQLGKFHQSYEAVLETIWDAKTIWGHWEDSLNESGLFPIG